MKLTRTLCLAALVGCMSTVASANQFYTDQATFMAQVVAPFYLEEFNGWSFGVPLSGDLSWNAPGANGFGYTVTAPPNGLFSIPGALSTNNTADPLIFTFAGNPVTAFGGNFYGSDFNGLPIVADVTYTTDTNETFTSSVTGLPDSFIGFTSATPIVNVTVSSAQTPVANWIAADNLVTGRMVPEPSMSILGLLGLAGLVGARLRRS